jgi:D-alanyl-lipoteichoic acid acyltransferase DltB (MBOAT superfamily)
MERKIIGTISAESGIIKPIYAVENHNVNLKELFVVAKYGKPNRYLVKYKLGWMDQEIIANYLDATTDNRTLIFANPNELSKTIGIPIRNIISCDRIK